jgi:hypothetical protein
LACEEDIAEAKRSKRPKQMMREHRELAKMLLRASMSSTKPLYDMVKAIMQVRSERHAGSKKLFYRRDRRGERELFEVGRLGFNWANWSRFQGKLSSNQWSVVVAPTGLSN